MRRAPGPKGGLVGAALALLLASAAAAEVRVDGEALIVDGRPFVARGAAGEIRLDLLTAAGATAVRTYGEETGRVLAEAERLGLKVVAGFWLEHPRRGFDYGDRARVEAQLAELRRFVARWRSHPALLLWGIGNEVEAGLADDAAVWPALEEAARAVKEADLDHPTMAVLAEAGGGKIGRLMRAAPSIDVLGVNSYGEALPSLPARVRAAGWRGPLLVTEMGAEGQWQAGKTPWGAAIELSSTDKAARLRRYLATLLPQSQGQFLFYWGQKQEVTPTWHSLLLAGGEWTETTEAMAESWGGRLPGGNRAPRIRSLELAADGRAATLRAEDPDGDRLAAEWSVMAESQDLREFGDAEAVPARFDQVLRAPGTEGVRLDPLPAGSYRLFVTLRDGRGAAATANLPFRVP